MGDRANFGLRQNDGNIIFIYGHWAGEGMFARFANALERATNAGRLPRDEAYANRIIISDLVGPAHQQDLGWGVTVNTLADNEHKVPVYDYKEDTVTLYNADWDKPYLGEPIFTLPRFDFIRKYAKSEVMA